MISCLEEHGEWIWEELSFYKTLSQHWWQEPEDPVFTHDIYSSIDFSLFGHTTVEVHNAVLVETLDMLI